MTRRAARKAERREHARVRLKRLVRLRELDAPSWIIKNEQVSLVCNRRGLRASGKLGATLFEKHVKPLVGGEE